MWNYLRLLGLEEATPATVPFDPGLAPAMVKSYLEQSHHLMHYFKLSMSTWLIAQETSTRAKLEAARDFRVRTVAGGGPFEIAAASGCLPQYLELCAELGFNRIEAGEGFTANDIKPSYVVNLATEIGLTVQYEVGAKFAGSFAEQNLGDLLDKTKQWLDAGAEEIVVEAKESAQDVGLFDKQGKIDFGAAEKFLEVAQGDFSLIQFEAPTKASQFALIDHFGPRIQLSNVRLDELLRVEIYRHGLHSQSFQQGCPATVEATRHPTDTGSNNAPRH